MVKQLSKCLLKLFQKQPKKMSINEAVEHSVEKYYKTYKLLEKYEKTRPRAPFLADDEDITRYFRQI